MSAVIDVDKAYATLRAELALAGHALTRSDPDEGPVRYFVSRWQMVRELRDLDAVRAFALQVGAIGESPL